MHCILVVRRFSSFADDFRLDFSTALGYSVASRRCDVNDVSGRKDPHSTVVHTALSAQDLSLPKIGKTQCRPADNELFQPGLEPVVTVIHNFKTLPQPKSGMCV